MPGLPQGVPVDTAIQINGGATTVLQLQDGHRLGRGHPASHMGPALLALAEQSNADAETVMAAFVAGYEVGARIGIALNGLDPLLHDTGTWTSIGTAVATACVLMPADGEKMAEVIEASAAVALMPYRDLPVAGATAHHLYIGLGALGGVAAARAVQAGLTSLEGTVETFFGPRAGADFEADALINGLDENDQWSGFEILKGYIKVHPTCAHLHGANDAVLALLQAHTFEPGDITAVDIATYAAGLAFDNPSPQNDLAARFSLTATTAVALCTGRLDETSLNESALTDPSVQEMMKKITVTHDPELDKGYPAGRPTRLTVSLTDGRQLTETVNEPLGDHTNPLSVDAVEAKSERLLSLRFDEKTVKMILSAFRGYINGSPIQELSQALRSPAKT